MSSRERTRQQLDPAGTTGVRQFTIAVAIGAWVYAVVVTLLNFREINDPPLAILSVLLLSTAVAIVWIATSPLRAPLTRRDNLLIQGSALVAYFAGATSTIGENAFVRDDWGPVVLGILLLALGPYRPAQEIAATGIVGAIFVGFVTLVQVRWFVTDGPPLAFVVVAVTPLIAMCLGAVAYSIGVVNAIERWQRRARAANRGHLEEVRGSIARSVQQDRVTILGRDVLPFFGDVLAQDRLTDADRERAREISRSIRDLMVLEANRSWLESLVAQAGFESGADEPVVDDRDQLAGGMSLDQRTSIRALLVAVRQTPEFDPGTLRVRLVRDGDLRRAVLSAGFTGPDAVPRSAFSPYFALMRTVFDGFDVEFHHPSLRVRFWYD
ncbi:MAG: hypothetical protein JWN80_1988 [Microbacteriaceae bacterium]|jgi:hypothetical protein|nr:hypothetical protein [Microbacteriaceae bacterium]